MTFSGENNYYGCYLSKIGSEKSLVFTKIPKIKQLCLSKFKIAVMRSAASFEMDIKFYFRKSLNMYAM